MPIAAASEPLSFILLATPFFSQTAVNGAEVSRVANLGLRPIIDSSQSVISGSVVVFSPSRYALSKTRSVR